jgi:hypothetical protein
MSISMVEELILDRSIGMELALKMGKLKKGEYYAIEKFNRHAVDGRRRSNKKDEERKNLDFLDTVNQLFDGVDGEIDLFSGIFGSNQPKQKLLIELHLNFARHLWSGIGDKFNNISPLTRPDDNLNKKERNKRHAFFEKLLRHLKEIRGLLTPRVKILEIEGMPRNKAFVLCLKDMAPIDSETGKQGCIFYNKEKGEATTWLHWQLEKMYVDKENDKATTWSNHQFEKRNGNGGFPCKIHARTLGFHEGAPQVAKFNNRSMCGCPISMVDTDIFSLGYATIPFGKATKLFDDEHFDDQMVHDISRELLCKGQWYQALVATLLRPYGYPETGEFPGFEYFFGLPGRYHLSNHTWTSNKSMKMS